MERFRINLLVLCGDALRHKYFATRLIKCFPETRVILEEKNVNYKSEFNKTEHNYFIKYVKENEYDLNKNLIGTVKNVNEEYEQIKELTPRLLAVHGTSIIKGNIIEPFPKRIINLHAGLSPYYRGSGTNMFPFYNNELEYVGMTVHFLDKGIDSGDIILHGRPVFEENDNTHTIGCKNVILGTDLMIKVIRKYIDEGSVPSKKQSLEVGKLYLKKDFTEIVSKQIEKNIEDGIVKQYIKNQKYVNIIEW